MNCDNKSSTSDTNSGSGMAQDHVHDESADSKQVHAQYRHAGEIQTRNFRLSRTTGTDTRFSLTDRRNLAEMEFDHVRVGLRMGRGDTVQFYVGDVDEEAKRPHRNMTRVGDYYQHDLDITILETLNHIEENRALPQPDLITNSIECE